MSKTDKLIEKLSNGHIDGDELISLLGKLGWFKDEQEGSHEQWRGPNGEKMTLKYRRHLLPYQIKEAKLKLLK